MPQRRTLSLVLFLSAVLLWAGGAPAATWELEGTVSDERKTEVTAEGGDHTETFKQSYSVSYELDVNPVLRLAVGLTLDVTDETKDSPDPDPAEEAHEVKPDLDVTLEGVWWDLQGTYEFTQKTSSAPDVDRTVDEGWLVEFTGEPAGDSLPDLKLKFERVRAKEGAEPSDREDRIEGSLGHTVWEILDLSFDVKRDRARNENAVSLDFADGSSEQITQITEDRAYKIDVSLDKELLTNAKFSLSWTNERNQTVEFFEDTFLALPEPIIADEVTSRDDTLKNNLKGELSYAILQDLELTLGRQLDWNKDLEVGTLEVTDTWTGEAAYGRSLTETLDIDLSYGDERKDTRGTDSGSYAITRDYAAALDFSPLENLDISPSFDRSAKLEWFDDPAQEADDSVDDKWEVKLDSSVWKDQVEFSVTRTFATKTEQGVKTTNERNWDMDFTISFEGLPNLELSPQYTYTQDRDLLADTTSEEKKIEVGLVYELKLGDVTTFTVDHSYARTSKNPADGQATVLRDDNTDLSLAFDNFLEGMSLDFGLSRKGTDESEDDKVPEVDYTYDVAFDYEFLQNYTFSFEYKFDKKQESEDTRNLNTTLSMEFLEGLLTIDLEHELDQQLEGDKRDTHRYLIEVTGKF